MSTSGPCTEFPAPDLRNPNRYITGHNKDGEAVFIQDDHGDHQSVMVGGAAAQSIFYSSGKNPIDLNGDADLEFAKQRVCFFNKASLRDIAVNAFLKPSIHIPNGCVVRMIDFAPGKVSNMHQAVCVGVGTVCEGEIELTLGSGEQRIMHPGDVSVNRGTMHQWRNTSPDKPARMLYFMLDVKPIIINGKALEFEMGYLMKEYAEYKEGEGDRIEAKM